MKRPRVSVGAVMFGLVVVAIDCVIYRSVGGRPESLQGMLSEFVLASLPMANVLSLVVASAIRGRAEARPARLGFVGGAGLALLTTVAGLSPALDRIEPVLTRIGLVGWMGNSPIREMVVYYSLVCVLPLLGQSLVGLVGGRIGGMVAGRRGRERVEAERPGRYRVAALAAIVLLAAVPALAVEGYLMREIDPKLARLEVGSEAVVDFKLPFAATLPKGSPIRKYDGMKVRVEEDREPFMIELYMIQGKNSKETKKGSHDRRTVWVKLLDGPRAGESTGMPHCFLRAIR